MLTRRAGGASVVLARGVGVLLGEPPGLRGASEALWAPRVPINLAMVVLLVRAISITARGAAVAKEIRSTRRASCAIGTAPTTTTSWPSTYCRTSLGSYSLSSQF